MKTYLKVTVFMHNGDDFKNPLQMKEVYIVGQLAREHKRLEVETAECTKEEHRLIFGV